MLSKEGIKNEPREREGTRASQATAEGIWRGVTVSRGSWGALHLDRKQETGSWNQEPTFRVEKFFVLK